MSFLYLRGTSAIYLVGGAGSGADSMILARPARTDAGAAAGLAAFTPMTAEAVAAMNPDVILVMTKGLESVGGVEGLLQACRASPRPAPVRSAAWSPSASTLLLSFGPRTGGHRGRAAVRVRRRVAVTRRTAWVALALGLACVVGSLLALRLGVAEGTAQIVWEIRAPRVAALLVGGGLGAAGGALMQGSLSNPLADPRWSGSAPAPHWPTVAGAAVGLTFGSLGAGLTATVGAGAAAAVEAVLACGDSRPEGGHPAAAP
ncbi:MAG: iron chelate uptake ABC transporter family permease subunit [Candidatus Nanopelagicales bacterium]